MSKMDWLYAAIAGALIGASAVPVNDREWWEDNCATDTCVFLQCEKELKRPCTDEDVFGPAEEEEDESGCFPDAVGCAT